MEKCKFCQAELTEDMEICPACGKEICREPAVQEEPAETMTAAEEKTESLEEAAAQDTVQAEAVPEDSTAEPVNPEATDTQAEETAAEEPARKKATPGKIALAVVAVVVLAGILIALIAAGKSGKAESQEQPASTEASVETVNATVPADGNPEDATCKGTYTVSDEEALAARETVVASIGEHQLTNGQLQVYYWSMVNSFLQSEYGYYMLMYGALDYAQPLDTQICAEDNTLTWQQYFLQEALDYWQLSLSLAGEAQKAGMTISQEDEAQLKDIPAALDDTAAAYNMTRDELLRNNMGPGAALEDYVAFQRLYVEGRDYYQNKLAEMVPTQEDLDAFYAAHEADYVSSGITKDATYVDVRHILVKVTGGTTGEDGTITYSDEEWAACEEKAQAILDAYLAGEKTEERFAQLANEKSEDPGSNTNGGLYEDVYKGQMVEPFENWCFDASRAYGDYGLVQTSYGYHVMFYVGSEPVWVKYAENDWITEQANQFIEGLTVGYPMDVTYENIVLGYINLGG